MSSYRWRVRRVHRNEQEEALARRWEPFAVEGNGTLLLRQQGNYQCPTCSSTFMRKGPMGDHKRWCHDDGYEGGWEPCSGSDKERVWTPRDDDNADD